MKDVRWAHICGYGWVWALARAALIAACLIALVAASPARADEDGDLPEPAGAEFLAGIYSDEAELSRFSAFGYIAEVPATVSHFSLKFDKNYEDTHCDVYKNGVALSGENMFINYGSNYFSVKTQTPSGASAQYIVLISREEPLGAPGDMTPLERSLVEIAFELLPEGHPFVMAYEEASGVDIATYTAKVGGRTVSGVPFEYGGGGAHTGFSSRWWKRTGVGQYPVGGLDCAEYIVWIYTQAGYSVKTSSASLFLSGTTGVEQRVPGVRPHLVIPSFDEAKIGDVGYNSQNYSYRSGHGNHTVMYLKTADALGITEELQKYYPGFPGDAQLAIDVGWADGGYYYNMMRALGVSGRSSMCGVGVQFFTSIKDNDGSYIYKSPYLGEGAKSYSYKDGSGHTFSVAASIERKGRPFQYKPYKDSPCEYVMNLSRPIYRYD